MISLYLVSIVDYGNYGYGYDWDYNTIYDWDITMDLSPGEEGRGVSGVL